MAVRSHVGAVAPRQVTPTSEKASDAAHVGVPVRTKTTLPMFEQPTEDGKLFANLAAHLALNGFGLHELVAGGYLIAHWDRTMHSSDLQGVAAFLRRLGVQQ